MGIETTRLLIVLDQADYRTQIADIFDPNTLPEKLSNHVSAIDLHILMAATQWSDQIQEIAIFSNHSAEVYSEPSYLGIRLMGGSLNSENVGVKICRDSIRLIADFCPTRIVLCSLAWDFLAWVATHKVPAIALLSQWHEPLGKQEERQHRQRIKQLNHPNIHWVGTHGIYACKILETSGIPASKLIPWGWLDPQIATPYSPKNISFNAERSSLSGAKLVELVCLSSIEATDQISDLLMAMSHLRQSGISAHLTLILDQDISADRADRESFGAESFGAESFKARSFEAKRTGAESQTTLIRGLNSSHHNMIQQQVQRLDLAAAVSFVGPLPQIQILEQMRAADLVVIPGTHPMPSRLPSSLYLALAARTPIIAADHPDFSEHLAHGINAMIFPAGNAKSMAHRIERIMGQPQLYSQISAAAEVALAKLKVPAQWAELIDRWLRASSDLPASAEHYQWLCNCAFSSGRYPLLPIDRRNRQQ